MPGAGPIVARGAGSVKGLRGPIYHLFGIFLEIDIVP